MKFETYVIFVSFITSFFAVFLSSGIVFWEFHPLQLNSE